MKYGMLKGLVNTSSNASLRCNDINMAEQPIVMQDPQLCPPNSYLPDPTFRQVTKYRQRKSAE